MNVKSVTRDPVEVRDPRTLMKDTEDLVVYMDDSARLFKGEVQATRVLYIPFGCAYLRLSPGYGDPHVIRPKAEHGLSLKLAQDPFHVTFKYGTAYRGCQKDKLPKHVSAETVEPSELQEGVFYTKVDYPGQYLYVRHRGDWLYLNMEEWKGTILPDRPVGLIPYTGTVFFKIGK